MRGDFEAFVQQCKNVRQSVFAMDKPLVVHHYDADGLSSAGVVANALRRAGKNYSMLVLKKIDAPAIAEARKRLLAENAGGIVFADLGSGQNALLEKEFVEKGVACAVIDHHVPQKKIAGSNCCQANCMDFGFDGSSDACSASTAFYVFGEGVPENADLLQLAVVGAVGDIQDGNGLVELNAHLVAEGVNAGVVEAKKDLRLFGRVSRSLVSFLAYSGEPFLPGLTGNKKAAALFLDDNGIPLRNESGEGLHYNDLDAPTQKKLASALFNHLLAKRVPAEVVEQLVGEVYEFPAEDGHGVLRDAHEYSTLLNACGRHGKAELGVAVTMRQPGALVEAEQILHYHRTLISRGIENARKATGDLGAFYFLDARGKTSDTIIGTVIGNFLNSGFLERDKPIIGFSTDEQGQTKASGRATKQLVKQGIDLNAVMRAAAEAAGGLGGGHKIAAGASFPAGKENEFLLKAAEALKKQLSKQPN